MSDGCLNATSAATATVLGSDVKGHFDRGWGVEGGVCSVCFPLVGDN